MNKDQRHLNVTAIENGTVIDHIPANNVFKVLQILKLDKNTNQVLFGDNLESHKFGKKGIYDLNASGVIIRSGKYEKVYQRVLIRIKV